MNRIPQRAEQAKGPPPSAHRVDQAKLTTCCEDGLRHSLFVPLHYEPNYAYPLLVWLHGSAGDERELLRIMPLISMRNYVAVAPKASCENDSPTPALPWRQTESEILAAEHLVFGAIELARQKFHIAPDRVFLAGFQSGGTMAFRVAMKHPQHFAGVLSVAGPFPSGNTPLARIAQARRLPLFVAQGRYAVKYPVEKTCEDLRLFHVAGLSVTLRQYPCGDELDSQMLHDMDVWMMEQVTGVSMCSDDDEQGATADWN